MSLPPAERPEGAGGRGLGWFVAAFALCPCHLPIYAALLGGTALGAALAERLLLAALALAGAFVLFLALGLRARRAGATRPRA